MVYQIKIGSLNFSDVKEKGEYSMFTSGVLIVIGIMLLIYGSKFFVNGAVNIATAYGIPESVIGVSLGCVWNFSSGVGSWCFISSKKKS